MRLPYLLLPLALGLAFLPTDPDRNVKLNGPLAPSLTGSVRSFQLTPDSVRVVYDIDRVLFSVPVDGSAPPVQLTPDPISIQRSVTSTDDYPMTPDGTRVVFRAREGGAGPVELFSVLVDGSAPPVRLHGPLVAGGQVASNADGRPAAISSDGTRVVYRADAELDEVFELYSTSVDGGQTPVKLNPDYTDIEDVTGYRMSPDSSFVVYVANQDLNFKQELYRVPIDASTPDFKVSDDLVPGGTVSPDYVITPNGSMVVYRAEQDADGRVEVYSVPLDGSRVSTKLCNTLDVARDVISFKLGPGGVRVAFVVRQLVAGPDNYTLWRRAVSGPGSPALVSASGGDYEFTSSGNRIVFEDQNDDLRSVSSSGGTPVVLSFEAFRWAVSGNRVLYTDYSSGYDLQSRPANASLPAVRLNDAHLASSYSWALSPDGAMVTFVSEIEGLELTSVSPVDGSTAALPVREGGAVELALTPDNTRVVFRAIVRIDFLTELLSVPADASLPTIRLSEPTGVGTTAEVGAFDVSPDGLHAVFLAPGEQAGVEELYSAPPDGSAAPERLNATPVPLGEILDFAISPDSASVVYRGDQDSDGSMQLYSVPIDGSGPPTLISDVLDPACTFCQVANYRITADGSRVVYRAASGPEHAHELYGVPMDGGSASVRLNQDLPVDALLADDFQVTPDGSRAVYRLDLPGGMDELYGVPVAGGSVPDRLDVPDVPHRGVRNFQISGDSTHVVFRARRDAGQGIDNDLYTGPIDGSAPAVKIAGASDLTDDVGTYLIAPDSSRIVYVIDPDGASDTVWSIVLDGSLPPVPLRDALPGHGGVAFLQISPDSQRLAFRQYTPDGQGLFVLPLDGSAPAVLLNPPLPQYAGIRDVRFTPDSSRVVYIADQDVQGTLAVHSVSVGGGATGRVSLDLLSGASEFIQFRISPDSRYVVYVTSLLTSSSLELFAGRVEGWTGPVRSMRINGPLVDGGDADSFSFLVTPDSQRVLYRAEQESPGMTELFSTFVVPEVASVSPNAGPASGGNEVAVTGCGFTPQTQVFFGGRPATSVTFVNASELRAVAPANYRLPSPVAGPPTGRTRRAVLQELVVSIRVWDAGLETTLPGGYTYLPHVR